MERVLRALGSRARAALQSGGSRARAALLGDERGVGVVTALMVTLVVFAVGVTWTGVGIHEVQSSSYERQREQALNAAEAGVNMAVGRLASDQSYAGGSGVLGDNTGRYSVAVAPVNPSDPANLGRIITSTGTSAKATRKVQQQVAIVPDTGFKYALFASPQGITGDNNLTVTGDVYSYADVSFSNFSKVFGTVVSLGNVTTANNCTIGGDVKAAGNVTISGPSTTVTGSVYAGGDVTVYGKVQGDVQAGGTVTVAGTGSVAGTITQRLAPPAPPALVPPTFSWSSANYPSPQTWPAAAAFNASWALNRNAFGGAHRVLGGDSVLNTVSLDQKTTLTGDTTIVTDGPVSISRDIANSSPGNVTLVVVSFSSQYPAIDFSNNVTLPTSVDVLFFAPNGTVRFNNLKDFHGTVYAKQIVLSQQFTLAWSPVKPPGFTWGPQSSAHATVQLQTFREVPAG